MKLKKSKKIPFYKTREYSLIYIDEKDLATGIINVCNILNKAILVIQTFAHDEIMNNLLQEKCHGMVTNRNWNYYFVDTLSFLTDVNLENQRFLCIYAIEKFYENYSELDKQLRTCYFEFVLENYLELTILRINTSHYSKEIIDKLLDT